MRRPRTSGHARTHAPALSLVLLSCLIAACNLPFQSITSPPPPPGSILYVLSNAPPAQQTPQPTTSVAYTVTALRSGSAQPLWQSPAAILPLTNAGFARIISGGSTLYVSISTPQVSGRPSASAHGRLIALDARAGKALWNVEIDGANLQQLTVAPNGQLSMQVDNRVEALDGTTGARLWNAPAVASYQITQLAVTKSAVYVEQEAYFLRGPQRSDTYDSAIVRALRLSDGHELWQREVANTIDDGLLQLARVSMQADEQAVYLLRYGQVQESHGVVAGLFPRTTLFALNAPDGSDRWSNPTQRDDAGRGFDLFLSGQTLYVRGVASPGMSSLSAFQRQSGAPLWAWRTPFVLNPFMPPDHAYGSSLNKGESFCALKSNDGSKVWCADYNQAGRVLFGQGRLYLVAFKIISQGATTSEQAAQLYVLDESDGSLIAQYTPGGEKSTAIVDLALS